jgi:choline-sulfatase
VPDDYPWHYFVSFVGPHNPFDPPGEYAERYRGAEMPPAIEPSLDGKPAFVRRRQVAIAPDERVHTRRQYCAAIELIDDHVGRMLEALEARGMSENTWVLFASDHGEMLGDHGLYTKSVAYEASLRVPLLAAGPGIPGGRTSDALVELIDLNPTICELAGLPAQENIDAVSFAPLLRDEAETHRADAVSALRHLRCIRTARDKLIQNFNDAAELYDLEADPDERHNIAAEQPERVAELSARLTERFLEGQWRR